MSDRVFLVLSDVTAAMLEAIVSSRIVTIDDTECGNKESAHSLAIERAHLASVERQLKAPT
jgi:hypothetical protein